MIPEVLVAWIETEGSFCLNITQKKPLNSEIMAQIAQNDKECLDRMQNELGFGKVGRCGNGWILAFRSKNDLRRLLKILDKVPKSGWYTHKWEQFQATKKFLDFKENRREALWSPSDVETLIRLRRIISPKHKTPDDVIREYLKNRVGKSVEQLEQIKDILINMRKNKNTAKEIAAHFEVRVSTLYNWYRRLEIPRRKQRRGVPPEDNL